MNRKPVVSKGVQATTQKLNSKNVQRCCKNTIKWIGKEIVSGLAIAAAVALATIFINNRQALATEREHLQSIHLGLNQQYIENLLEIPMVQFHDQNSGTDFSFYKQKHSVVWCAYCNNEVVAYVVIVNSNEKVYQVARNLYLKHNDYLTDFTYEDFSNKLEHYEINVPVNNDDYAYYSELYYGAGPADYNYLIIGTYKNYFEDDVLISLSELQFSNNQQDLIKQWRHTIAPNAYGMIMDGYQDIFTLIPIEENLRVYNNALFGDWYG